MNPITFNDIFNQAIERLPERVAGGKPEFGNWRTAPLFDYETTYEREQQVLEERDGVSFPEIESMRWPFETFRLNLTEHDVPMDEQQIGSPNNTYKTRMIVHRTRAGVVHMLVLFRQFHRSNVVILAIRSEGTTDGKGFTQVYTPELGLIADVSSPRLHGASIMAGSAVGSLGTFLLDANSPTNHIVEVRPNQPHRSVQWLLARTHFTLIHHAHPANKKDVQEHERVAVDHAAELRRMSHDRRGHWRTYRHARYTYARGSTRWVKQAWCGPKEWQSAGGKQVYKILEPVDDLSVQVA